MKRILSVALSVFLIISALTLTSCSRKPADIGNINGADGREACRTAFDNLRAADSYRMDMDIEFECGILFVTVPARIDDVFVTAYIGDNMHYKFTDESFLLLSNGTLADMLGDDFGCKEVWVVGEEGYVLMFDNTEFECSSRRAKSAVSWSEKLVEKIETLIADENNEFICYADADGNKYVEVAMSLDNTFGKLESGEAVCRIYTDGTQIDKVTVDFELVGIKAAAFDFAGLGGTVTLNLEYDGIEPIEAPW